MPFFLNKLFKRKENSYRTRYASGVPHQNVNLSKKIRSFARPSSCCYTSEGKFKEECCDIGGHEGTSETNVCPTQLPHQTSYENQAKKKLSLEDLKRTSPPGFKEFEAAVALKELDEELALLLWEDIFKPLSSHFSSLQNDSRSEFTAMYRYA